MFTIAFHQDRLENYQKLPKKRSMVMKTRVRLLKEFLGLNFLKSFAKFLIKSTCNRGLL